MSLFFCTVADALLRASIDGALIAFAVFLLSRPLRQRIPLACVWLWRLVFVKFALGLFGIGIALGPARSSPAAQGDNLLPLLITAGLLIGLMLGGERLWRELRVLAQLHRTAQLPSTEWRESWERLCRNQKISRPPRLLVSDSVELPMAAGVFRPAVILPAGLTLNAADRERVLAHEYAHIRHGDLWFGWLVAVLEPLFFFHPLFWVARRELRLCQEIAADRRSLSSETNSAQEYARLLLTLSRRASLTSPVTLGIGESFQMLRHRIDALPQSRRPADALRFALTTGIVLGLLSLSLAHRNSPQPAAPKTYSAAAIAAPVALP